ncbi:amidohydrolase [Bacillus sp. sid0103]|uniref:amidohydrolase n=1 Tax=Bacillus sp. sid0103 TaxID=2856337 RepID=UPI001C459844|nr:amidohydrolase [Bacillus sp. sid0103]MBV7505311.1 amidohydrolase [Bacillus sp. sid0103]
MKVDLPCLVDEIFSEMVEWRRDFHKHAESGWLEFRTSTLVAEKLEAWGYEIKIGKDVIDSKARMGVPSEEVLHQHEKRARQQGANEKWLELVKGGHTGVVGILDTRRPGPTIGLRFDMDALDLEESNDLDHLPFALGFRSINLGMMHACGHDAHTSIGLGLAKLFSEMKEQLSGKIKLIFQPAEEGVRGAKSMVAAGVLDDVDVFIATHIGTGVPLGEIVCGNNGYLSTTKIDVTFSGVASHAGGKPEEGKNALLAGASAVLNLHGISRHSAGNSRINVGVLNAGTGRNIIPSSAKLKIETRGETSEVNEYILSNALNVLKGTAIAHQVEMDLDIVGEAKSCDCSDELVEFIHDSIQYIQEIKRVQLLSNESSGSEDATYMMEKVKSTGGLATYAVVGTTIAAGHHNEKFDIDELGMKIGLQALAQVVLDSKKLYLKTAQLK